MKKISIVMLLIVVLTGVVCLSACSDDLGEITIEKYEITEAKYTVGDIFDKTKLEVTAFKSDDTTTVISKNLVMGKESIDNLELDSDNKFTKAGSFVVKIYIIEENINYPEFFIGDWTVVVRAKK